MAAQAIATGFAGFAVANVVSRIGGAPQHPVGNALLAEQFPPKPDRDGDRGPCRGRQRRHGRRRRDRRAGDRRVRVAGLLAMLGVAAIVVAIAILAFVRERSTTAAALADGPVRAIYRRVLADRDLRWLFTAAVLGGGVARASACSTSSSRSTSTRSSA